jgi:hypothetical protein
VLPQEVEDRQGEGGGLAGPGLGGGEQVASGKDDGNGLRLDGGGFGVALLRDCAKQLGREPEAFKRRTDNDLLMIGPRSSRFDTGSGRWIFA